MYIKKLFVKLVIVSFLLASHASIAQNVSEMLDKTLGSVVTVAVYKEDIAKNMLGFRGGRASEVAYKKVLDLTGSIGTGSGFVIERSGQFYVITNAHVIEYASDEPGSIYIYSINRNKYEVQVVGGDSFYDIAILKFAEKPGKEIAPVAFRSEEAHLGEEVYAIGNPLGEYPYSVSNGIISAKNRVRGGVTGKFGFLQTTATVIWGNSGGPLIDKNGNVIGVNSQIAFATAPNGEAVWQSQINFALEGTLSERLIDDILSNDGRVERAYIGIELSQKYEYVYAGMITGSSSYSLELLDQSPVISQVIPSTPAYSKLKDYIGFSIQEINNTKVRNLEEAMGEFEKTKPGETIMLAISNGSTEKDISIKTGELRTQELELLADFVIQNIPSLEFISNSTQVYIQDTKKGRMSGQYQNREKNSYNRSRVPYTILGAGIYSENHKNIWLAENKAMLGAIFRLSGLTGKIDFYVLEQGAPEEDISLFSHNLSDSEYTMKSTLWY